MPELEFTVEDLQCGFIGAVEYWNISVARSSGPRGASRLHRKPCGFGVFGVRRLSICSSTEAAASERPGSASNTLGDTRLTVTPAVAKQERFLRGFAVGFLVTGLGPSRRCRSAV